MTQFRRRYDEAALSNRVLCDLVATCGPDDQPVEAANRASDLVVALAELRKSLEARVEWRSRARDVCLTRRTFQRARRQHNLA